MSNQGRRINLCDDSTWPVEELLSADHQDKDGTIVLPRQYLDVATSHG
jgi:hypothetical protein